MPDTLVDMYTRHPTNYSTPLTLTHTYLQEGVQWLASLYENWINGIIADDSGLNKTLQVTFIILPLSMCVCFNVCMKTDSMVWQFGWRTTFQRCLTFIHTQTNTFLYTYVQVIAFFANLWENNVKGPFLVVANLDFVEKWVKKFQKKFSRYALGDA